MGQRRKKKRKQKTHDTQKKEKTIELSLWSRIRAGFFKKKLSAADKAAVLVARWTLALVVIGIVSVWSIIEGYRADVQVIGLRFDPNPMVPGIPTKFVITIKNVGKTTAEIVEGSTNWSFVQLAGARLPDTPNYSQNGMPLPSNYRTHVIPDQIITANFFPAGNNAFRKFDADNLAKLYAGNAHFWVFGYFTYTDRYSIPWIGGRTTGFCYTYSPLGAGFVDCGDDGRNYMYE